MKEEENRGVIGNIAARYKHAHNEYLGQLATNGIVGLSILLGMIIYLWKQYSRYLHSASRESVHIAQAGIITLVLYSGFSLTESFFTSQLGAGYFVLVNCYLLYLLDAPIPHPPDQ